MELVARRRGLAFLEPPELEPLSRAELVRRALRWIDAQTPPALRGADTELLLRLELVPRGFSRAAALAELLERRLQAFYDPASRRLGMREADTNLMMFGFYIWNNTGIGFQTFAGGMLAGVGSVWFLASNGVILGAVSGYLTEIGYTRTFWSFVAGHSSWELIAIALSGAAGLRLGLAIIAPGGMSRRAALVAASRPAVHIMYGAALMFFIAAFVEAFWSPLTEVPFDLKIGVGIAGWVLLLAYFAFAGRSRAAR